jgi:hypothetical protein
MSYKSNTNNKNSEHTTFGLNEEEIEEIRQPFDDE